MKKLALIAITSWFYIFSQAQSSGLSDKTIHQTFCNPIDIAYRFELDSSYREAADPVIVLYHDLYWLFASKSGGYWYSNDMVKWIFIKPTGLPLETYAPAAAIVNNRLIFLAGNGAYTTGDPLSGKWVKLASYNTSYSDPALFLDDDGKLYLYHGCAENQPLMVVELDTSTFLPITQNKQIAAGNFAEHGWEVAGNTNLGKGPDDTSEKNFLPWVEGSWMNKINNKYYLQYAAPGTQFKTYGDGVFVADSAMGTFSYAEYSPFSFKPTGFVTGTGHSATFKDKNNAYWHVTTVALSVRHMFERRLAIFPAGVTRDGELVANTYLGDYPQYAPGFAKSSLNDNSPGWMLLSYHKKATASSTCRPIAKQDFNVNNAFDENMQTWWSAATGNAGESLQVDLGKGCRVNAIQINFADQDARARGHLVNDGYSYYVEASKDGKHWQRIIDRTDSMYDEPHHYVQLEQPVMARYIKIVNQHSPAQSLFSLYGLRVFGSGLGKLPGKLTNIKVERDSADQRHVHVSWDASSNTDFYIIRYGVKPDHLFSNYQVYNSNSFDIHSLNVNTPYYFAIDAVNDTGITKGKTI